MNNAKPLLVHIACLLPTTYKPFAGDDGNPETGRSRGHDIDHFVSDLPTGG